MSSISSEMAWDPVDALVSAATQLATRNLDALDEARLSTDVETLTRAAAQATAERLRCVAAIAGRSPDPAAGRDQAQRLLQTAGRLSSGQAAHQTRLATALADPRLEPTAAALAAGKISPAQADALAQAARTHPDLIAQAQDELIAQPPNAMTGRSVRRWPTAGTPPTQALRSSARAGSMRSAA